MSRYTRTYQEIELIPDIHMAPPNRDIARKQEKPTNNFRKFLKFKNSGKFGDKGKFMSSEKDKKDFKKKEGKES